jgi:beta-lactamase superfamily II metal-dependent hydrolase
MPFTVEFLPVDHGDMSGDSILICYGPPGNQIVITIDGGTIEAGEALVDHIKRYVPLRPNHTLPVIDHAVCTHPDRDHSSGVRVLLEKLPVMNLWMHRPWADAPDTINLFADKRLTNASLIRRLRDEYSILEEIEMLARQQTTPIHQPFQGRKIGDFTVLGPSPTLYSLCMANFDRTPDPHPSVAAPSFMEQLATLAKRKLEDWDCETLRDPDPADFRAENESSVVLWGNLDGYQILLTGDAGVHSLAVADAYAKQIGVNINAAHFVQIAHHGSRRSIGPARLNQLFGPRRPRGTEPFRTAFVSASKGSTRHPRKSVTNAYQRRGFKVCRTNGGFICYYFGVHNRDLVPIEPMPFFAEVEE